MTSISLVLTPQSLTSQTNRKPIAWTGFLNEFAFKKVDAFIEIENSRLLSPDRQDYFTILTNGEFSIKNFKLGGGLSGWLLYDANEMIVPELRPHQQFKWNKEQERYSFTQRTRIENRWIRDTVGRELQNSYSFMLRPRIFFQFAYSILKKSQEKGNLQVVFSNELILEYNRAFSGFSENRYYTGLWYTITKKTTVQLGYMWIFAVADQINNSDILYFTLRNNFNLK